MKTMSTQNTSIPSLAQSSATPPRVRVPLTLAVCLVLSACGTGGESLPDGALEPEAGAALPGFETANSGTSAEDSEIAVPIPETGDSNGNSGDEADNAGSGEDNDEENSDASDTNGGDATPPDESTPPDPDPDETADPAPDPEETSDPEPVANVSCGASAESLQASLLAAVNEARSSARSCGTTDYAATEPLALDTRLIDAAHAHSIDMTTNNFIDHTGSDGLGPADRATSAGYRWRTVGENIAAGQRTSDDAMSGWLQSPGHCRNIMNPSYEDIGVACVEASGTDYGRYWTMVLGRD